MTEFYTDIPRIHSAIAECMACFVSLLIFKCKKEKRFVFIASLIFFAFQCNLLYFTDDVSIFLWLPVMLVAISFMFFYIRFCTELSRKFTGYITAISFLQAELAASMEWQIHCWLETNIEFKLIFQILLLILFYAIVFFFFYILGKKSSMDLNYEITWKELIFTILITTLAFTFSNLSFINHSLPFTSVSRQEIFTIRTLTVLLGLAILYSYQNRIAEIRIKNERDSIQTVLDSQYQNFLNYKESIDVINIKYHDLKHQMQALRQEDDPQKREQWIDSLEQELELYNINFDTGNKVLDTILSTKELQCKKYGINITFLADGSLLHFVKDSDVVSIFGNALDNAIEAVLHISNQEKRLIHLEVSEKRSFVFIQCENTFFSPPNVKDGNFQTSKSDKLNHGFGIKSIKYTVKKYDGNLVIDLKDNFFRLNILLPKP